jgi:hypothetical protein
MGIVDSSRFPYPEHRRHPLGLLHRTAADRLTITHHLVQRIMATVPDVKDFVTVTIHWVAAADD